MSEQLNGNGPYFLGAVTYPGETHGQPHLERFGRPLWEGDSRFVTNGEWRQGEVRTRDFLLGKVAVVGHCLASDSELDARVDTALKQEDFSVMTSLPGSYTVIGLQRDQLTIHSDLAGRRPVYYAEDSDQALVSSSSKVIADITDAKINPCYITSRLTHPFQPFLTSGESYWEGIHSLEGGRVLSIDTQTGISESEFNSLGPLDGVTYRESVSLLRQALVEAVETRLSQAKKVTSDLSGGFDSTTLAMLMSSISNSRESDAFLFHNSSHASSEGDLVHARRIASRRNDIRLHEIDTMGHIPYQDIMDLPQRDEPDPGSLMPGGRDRAYFRAIREFGGVIHMLGGGADSLFSPSNLCLADMLNANQYSQFLRHAVATSRLESTSSRKVIAGALRFQQIGIQGDFIRFARDINTPDCHPPGELTGPKSGSGALEWLTPAARTSLGEYALQRAVEFESPPDMGVGDWYSVAMARSDARSYYRSDTRARQTGLEIHTPYYDNNVLTAAFAIPAWQRYDPHFFKKMLVESMDGLVPSYVYERTTKGDYGADLYAGIHAATPNLMRLFNDSALGDLGLIDPSKVLHVIESIATRPFPLPSLNTLVAAELWARRLPSSRLPTSLSSPARSSGTSREGVVRTKEVLGKYYTLQPGVHAAAAPDGSLAFLNEKKRKYSTTTPTSGVFLKVLNSHGGEVSEALETLGGIYSDINPTRLKDDLAECISLAKQQGILSEAAEPAVSAISSRQSNRNETRSSDEVLVSWQSANTQIRKKEALAGVGAFALALFLKRTPLTVTSKTLRTLHRTWAKQEATEEEALHAISAIQSVTRWHIGRVACLEESLAGALLLALQRRKVEWRVGTAFYPVRPHAQIVAAGKPLGKQTEYIPFLKVKG